MINVVGLLTIFCFILSIILFLSAIAASNFIDGDSGKSNVENLLVTSLLFMGLFIVGSVGLSITLIVHSIKLYYKRANNDTLIYDMTSNDGRV